MSPRPPRKKSALDSSPISVIAPATAPLSRPAAPAPPATPSPARTGVERLSIRVPAELIGEVRAAWWTTAPTTGVRSMSAWVIAALEAHLASERAAHNNGRPFVPVGPGELPTGPRP